MSRPNKKKIPTDAPAASGGGIFRPFANLEMGGLPTGTPDAAEPAEVHPVHSVHFVHFVHSPGRVVLRRETAHRGGKCVIVLDGFDSAIDGAALQNLLKRLRAACGCGGTVAGRTIELQGDQATRIRELLAAEGFCVAGEG